MSASMDIHANVIKALKKGSWKNKGLHGFLVGRRKLTTTEVLFPTYCASTAVKDILATAARTRQILPGGYDICGVILALDDKSAQNDLLAAVQNYVPNQLLESFDSQSLVICHAQLGSSQIGAESFSLLDEEQNIPECGVNITENDVLSDSVVFRLQVHIPVTICVESNSKDWQQSITSEISRVTRSISSAASVYSVKDTGIHLTSQEVKGVSGGLSCDKLYQHVQSEDGHVTRSKKKAKEQGPLGVDMFLLISGESEQSDVPCCSPVLHHSIGDYTSAKLVLPLNVLSVVKSDTPVKSLHDIFTSAIVRQLDAMRDYLLSHLQAKGEKLTVPEVLHFRPSEEQMFVTAIYPSSVPDSDLENQRRDLHNLLLLATNRPLFRRNTAYLFPGEPTPQGYLLNPHRSLTTAGTVGKHYVVSGTYSYHHYMQDRFDDNQWGCAYRSLQTLVSWFRFQGYTEKPIPTHREIQQALVDVGDKQKGFIGSKRWIGSLEVGYCLDHLIGVTCKIMNVSSGADLAGKGRELAAHFTNQGTPIMIGGGVLAHTILGVDFDEVTGNIRFLILDPHYTGSEDLKVILDKGWCGWKGPDFWDVHAHYNLCMPQTPNVI